MGNKDVGRLIQARREAAINPVTGKAWTQDELGDAVGLKRESVGHLERGRGKNVPGPELLNVISQTLGNVTVAEMLQAVGYDLRLDGELLTPEEEYLLGVFRQSSRGDRAALIRVAQGLLGLPPDPAG